MKQWIVALVAAGSLLGIPAQAHDWYPAECCNGSDCAPADAVVRLSSDGKPPRLLVTSKHGTALVPVTLPYRESKDHRMHICMRPSLYGGMGVICIFMPPSMY
jgi:hypothetical protein